MLDRIMSSPHGNLKLFSLPWFRKLGRLPMRSSTPNTRAMSICEFCQKIFLGCADNNRNLRPLVELETSHHFDCPLCTYFKTYLGFTAAFERAKLVFSLHHYHESDIILPLWFGTPRLPILELQLFPESGASPRPRTYRAFTNEDTL
jgi:hypothetical protein